MAHPQTRGDGNHVPISFDATASPAFPQVGRAAKGARRRSRPARSMPTTVPSATMRSALGPGPGRRWRPAFPAARISGSIPTAGVRRVPSACRPTKLVNRAGSRPGTGAGRRASRPAEPPNSPPSPARWTLRSTGEGRRRARRPSGAAASRCAEPVPQVVPNGAALRQTARTGTRNRPRGGGSVVGCRRGEDQPYRGATRHSPGRSDLHESPPRGRASGGAERVPPAGLEPAAKCLEGTCSIH